MDDQQTNAEMIDKLAGLPVAFQPGTTFEYGMSNDVIGRIVEVLSGRDLNQFVAERIACVPISAPPDDIPPLPAAMGRTNRETVEAHTEVNTICAGCHKTLINPFGFPFESYDATGAWRTTDNGMPVRTDASPFVDRELTPVADQPE